MTTTPESPFLTVAEAAALARLSPKRLQREVFLGWARG